MHTLALVHMDAVHNAAVPAARGARRSVAAETTRPRHGTRRRGFDHDAVNTAASRDGRGRHAPHRDEASEIETPCTVNRECPRIGFRRDPTAAVALPPHVDIGRGQLHQKHRCNAEPRQRRRNRQVGIFEVASDVQVTRRVDRERSDIDERRRPCVACELTDGRVGAIGSIPNDKPVVVPQRDAGRRRQVARLKSPAGVHLSRRSNGDRSRKGARAAAPDGAGPCHIARGRQLEDKCCRAARADPRQTRGGQAGRVEPPAEIEIPRCVHRNTPGDDIRAGAPVVLRPQQRAVGGKLRQHAIRCADSGQRDRTEVQGGPGELPGHKVVTGCIVRNRLSR